MFFGSDSLDSPFWFLVKASSASMIYTWSPCPIKRWWKAKWKLWTTLARFYYQSATCLFTKVSRSKSVSLRAILMFSAPIEVGEYLVVVCRHFGVEPNEPNLNTKVTSLLLLKISSYWSRIFSKINEQLVKYAHDIRTSKMKKDAGKQKMEPLLAEGKIQLDHFKVLIYGVLFNFVHIKAVLSIPLTSAMTWWRSWWIRTTPRTGTMSSSCACNTCRIWGTKRVG